MEFYSLSINGHKVNVIFNGGIYIFHNSYGGLVCVADRDVLNNDHFQVTTGNRHFIGGSLTENRVKSAVCRFIRKCESKYMEKEITFSFVSRDLANDYVTINHVQN